jgi:hypothetical protein
LARNRGTRARGVPDAKHIEAYLVSQRDRLERLAGMSRGIDCLVGRPVNGCRYETVSADLHLLVILIQAITRCWEQTGERGAAAQETTIHDQSQRQTVRKHQYVNEQNVDDDRSE